MSTSLIFVEFLNSSENVVVNTGLFALLSGLSGQNIPGSELEIRDSQLVSQQMRCALIFENDFI